MAVAPDRPHYVQACDGPVFIGPGTDRLDCRCGNTLIEGYDQARFLAVGLQCGRCGSVTMTAPLPDLAPPPVSVLIAEPIGETRLVTAALPDGTSIVGKKEMDRLTALFRPQAPPDNTYRFTPALLDAVEASVRQITGLALPSVAQNGFDGMQHHALGWAVGHLRGRMAAESWFCQDSEATAAACCLVAGFQHFVATWSHYALFEAMVATAAEAGFSAHGLAPFAAAHCLTMQGNKIGFPPVVGGKLDGFHLLTASAGAVAVLPKIFDRFEYPAGQAWNAENLRAAVIEAIEAEQARINPRNPGLLLLSPGTALSGFDEALIVAIQAAIQAVGRRQRGLMAVAPIVLRILPGRLPNEIQFGYGFFPVTNRHYRGQALVG